MEIGTVARGVELGVFLKNQMGKELTVDFNVVSNLDSDDADYLSVMLGHDSPDTLTLTLASDDDIEQILSRLGELQECLSVGEIGRSYYFEGFSHTSCSCCVRVVLQWGT